MVQYRRMTLGYMGKYKDLKARWKAEVSLKSGSWHCIISGDEPAFYTLASTFHFKSRASPSTKRSIKVPWSCEKDVVGVHR